jgi:hypothetical protein
MNLVTPLAKMRSNLAGLFSMSAFPNVRKFNLQFLTTQQRKKRKTKLKEEKEKSHFNLIRTRASSASSVDWWW